eukprot:m.432617 g.432617  ORF g.432617 m.432617 type:complete len:593 (-) comp56750_c0_seq1:137-1915(-)
MGSLQAVTNIAAVLGIVGEECTAEITWRLPTEATRTHYSRLFMRDITAAEGPMQVAKDCRSETNYTVTGLKRTRTYQFSVQTYYLTQLGPFSETVTLKTPDGVPSKVQDFRIDLVTTDDITVSWRPPTVTNGLLKRYILLLDYEACDEYVEMVLPITQTQHKFTNLFKGIVYRFQVLAGTDAGDGEPSDLLEHALRDPFAAFKADSSTPVSAQKDKTISRSGSIFSMAGSLSDTSETDVAPPPLTQPAAASIRPTKPTASSTDQSDPPPLKPSRSFLARQFEAAVQQQNSPAPKSQPVTDPQPLYKRNPVAPVMELSDALKQLALKSQPAPAPPPPEPEPAPPQQPAGKPFVQETRSMPGLKYATSLPTRRLSETPFKAAPEPVEQPASKFVPSANDPRFVVSGNKTIRGKKNAVRATMQSFTTRTQVFADGLQAQLLYESEQDGRVVIYLTSMQAIRQTYSECQAILQIMYNMSVRLNIKDISMHPDYAKELETRLSGAKVPQLFFKAQHVGNYEQVLAMNETGKLKTLLADAPKRGIQECGRCGGRGYFLCTWCQGSRKSLYHGFPELGNLALKCTVCNKFGLQKCEECV